MRHRKVTFAGRLSRRVTFATAGLVVIILLAVAAISIRIVGEEAFSTANAVLKSTILDIEDELRVAEVATNNNTWKVLASRKDEAALYDITHQMVAANPAVIGSAIAFPAEAFKGRYYFAPYSYASSPEDPILSCQMGGEGYDYFSMDWYLRPMEEGEPCWVKPYFDEGATGWAMATYSNPVMDSSGRTIAILTADISLKGLTDTLSQIRPYDGAYIVVLSDDGTIICHPDKSNILTKDISAIAEQAEGRSAEELMKIGKEMVAGESGANSHYREKGEGLSFVVYGPLSNGWSVALVCPYNSVFAAQGQMIWAIIIIAFFGLNILFFVSRGIILRKSKPIAKFSDSALSIACGNFETELMKIDTHDELQTLRDSLDYMQKSLANYVTKLQATTAAKERYQSELNIAREIQKHMLPYDFPKSRKCGLHALVIPAREMGGDYYDFKLKDDKTLCFSVGDVSGKGVPAALFMAITRAAFRFLAGLGQSLEKNVSQINNTLSDGNEQNMFVTMFAGKLNLETGELLYCNAGHNPIMIITPDGKASYLKAKPNLAVGLFRDFPYQSETITLEKGTRLLIYTDGVTEAEKQNKEQYGEDRLLQWAETEMAKAMDAEPDEFKKEEAASNALLDSVRMFTSGNEQNDDITIMTISYK